MIIYGVFIIKSDGTPLLTEYFQSKEDLPDSAMLGRFFIAIKGFTDQVAEAVKTTATAKSHVAEMTKVMSQNTSALGGSLGKRPSNNVPDWLPGG